MPQLQKGETLDSPPMLMGVRIGVQLQYDASTKMTFGVEGH